MSKLQTFLTIEPDGSVSIDGSLSLGVEAEGTKLQIDPESHWLYVDGKPVITERRITLPWFVNLAVIFASIATVGMFVLMIFK